MRGQFERGANHFRKKRTLLRIAKRLVGLIFAYLLFEKLSSMLAVPNPEEETIPKHHHVGVRVPAPTASAQIIIGELKPTSTVEPQVTFTSGPKLKFLNKTKVTEAPRTISTGKPHLKPAPKVDYVLNPTGACQGKYKDVQMVTFVHTAPAHYQRRQHIRETWGSQRFYPSMRNVVLFTMGRPTTMPNDSLQLAIEQEFDLYHDIIQGDFFDSYKNLTLKGVMWLSWTAHFCSTVRHVLKVDDDVMVNIANVVRHLTNLYNYGYVRERALACLVWFGMPVIRDVYNKWHVPYDDYPNDTYPTYCSGMAYAMSGDVATILYKAALVKNFFWVDDTFVTGILPAGENVNFHQLSSLYVLKPDELEPRLVDNYGLFGHMPGSITRRQQLWRKILRKHAPKLLYDPPP